MEYVHSFIIVLLDMRANKRGITEEEIQHMIDFDWDKSSSEDESDDEVLEDFLEESIQDAIDSGESIEIDLLKKLVTEDRGDIIQDEPHDIETVQAQEIYEKLDIKNLRWRNSRLKKVDTTWKGSLFENGDFENENPIDYFNRFIDDEITERMRTETNLYALQKDGIELKCSIEEIRRFIGVLLYTGVIKVPQLRMAWMKELRLTAVVDSLSRNRFEKIKQYFHFNDNTKQVGKDHPNYDKVFKVRPLLDKLENKFNQIPQEEYQSIDEQIIPYKGRKSLKQYLPKKPHKWGFKMFTRSGVSGIMYNFSLYVGEGTCPSFGLGLSSDIILHLSSTVPENQNFKLFFDNWFCSISLMNALKEKGILSVGTIRSNRLGNCKLALEKCLAERGRGSYDIKTERAYNITACRWYDNKGVQLISNYIGDNPVGKCTRWSGKEKKYLDIPRPAIVECYNKHMGGVDLSDMLLELYRINHRSKKWYMRIAYWCFNAAVVNSWLLYRRHLRHTQPGIKHMPLIRFQLEISHELLNASATSSLPTKRKRGHPSSLAVSLLHEDSAPVSPVSKKTYTPEPSKSQRYDGINHWIQWGSKGRCRLCKTGFPRSKCTKCNIYLCSNPHKNCFVSYHT